MAVYFDQKLETDFNSIKTDCLWHNDLSVLAVVSCNDLTVGSVAVYTEDGNRLQAPTVQRSSIATASCWHPIKKIIVVGWESGDVTLHNVEDGDNLEAASVHTVPITQLAYSAKATHLISADKAGIVSVWKSVPKGRLQGVPMYQVNINEPVTQLLCRSSLNNESAIDINKLAKAAVSGDEAALDMFTWTKGNSTSSSLTQSDALGLFVGGASGGIYNITEDGGCNLVTTVESSVKTLLWYDQKNILVTVTDNLSLTQHSMLANGDVEEINRVKLNGKADDSQIIWAGTGLLAISTSDVVIRMLDMERGDNYFLSLESHSGYNTNEGILCLSYCSAKGILAGGTNMGNIAIWTNTGPLMVRDTPDPESQWKLQAPSTVEGPVTQLHWGSKGTMLAANTSYNVFILSEQVMNYSYSDQIAVLQVGPCQLTIDVFSTNCHHDLKTDIQVKGVCTTQDALTVWNGKKAVVYEYAADKSVMSSAGAFATEATRICMYEQNLYTLELNKVHVRTFQGTVKQTINFTDPEGLPICVDVCSSYLVIGTSSGLVKVYDLSRREAKLHSSPKQVSDHVTGFGSLVSAKCNCAGNRVSVLASNSEGVPDDKLYMVDLEMDTVQYFSFHTGHGEQDDYLTTDNEAHSVSDADLNDDERGKTQAARDVAGRYPVSHMWDPEEPKLLVCEAVVSMSKGRPRGQHAEKVTSFGKVPDEHIEERLIVSLFSTSENGVLAQGSYPLPQNLRSLLGVHVPYHYFLRKSEETSAERESGDVSDQLSLVYPKMVSRQIMRDFVGLDKCDKLTRDAMINFSFYLAIGNMDEAFKAIKLIKSESVWQNMAKMCVKSRRLDVASVCLGNMGDARGAMMLREAMKEPELDARVAVLAVQLELYEDAERLLRNCKRYDLLNQFYQASDQWGRSMETAEMYDRIHLRSTYYNYGKHLEARGDLYGAIPNYEKSDTHRFEVPRMFYDEPESLETYIMGSKDPALRKWWAQYLESTGEMEAALQFYEAAQDYLSLVRVYCFCDNVEKATQICNETGNRAACYHLARQYERIDKIQEAIHFFSRAQAYGNAIRLCKEHKHDDQILNLALLGKPEDMMEGARYFEEYPSMHDKAVMLYHKSGNFTKALDLAFQHKQFGALQLISSQLDERADPALLRRCADFFLDNHQYDKAVELFGLGRKYTEAISVCLKQHVEMSEELAEKLTPSKDDQEYDVGARNKILEGIAEVAMHQGQWHVATKKFTQAGNKTKAMKALLKSGDTEKIVFFAGVSRQKEIYVMAANYLQSLDWHQDPDIMKNIINFYTKGRALESLSLFYDACSQIEIDEYQNYEKAMGALGEAYKCLSKAQSGDSVVHEQKLESYNKRIELIRTFVSIKREYEEDADKAIHKCEILLEERDVNRAVRVGDIYAFMIAHHFHRSEWKQAYSNLEKMRGSIPYNTLQHFLSLDTITHIHDKMGMRFEDTYSRRANGLKLGGADGDDGDEVEENVIEGYTD